MRRCVLLVMEAPRVLVLSTVDVIVPGGGEASFCF